MSKGRTTATTGQQDLSLLARAIVVVAIILIIAGVFWHGVTIENFHRMWHDITNRPRAALSFRFILQPCVAAVAAINDGVKDAAEGRSPFFSSVFREPAERVVRFREGLNATAKMLALGIMVDVAYQLMEFKQFYPVESLLIALLLVLVPYLLIRGLVVRILRRTSWTQEH